MRNPNMLWLRIAVGFAPVVIAQLSGWEANQVSATMCTWLGQRVAVLRDTVYLDGGYVEWRPGLSDGSYGDVIKDANTPGVVYTLNFSLPFNTSQNISALFQQQVKGSSYPLYYDGALLANDDEYFLFGGMLTVSDTEAAPAGNQVLEWEGYDYGVVKPAFSSKFRTEQLSGNITRYVAYGGAANVPSENLAFYFSGLHGKTWGEIYYPTGNDSTTAIEISNTLITLDMTTQQYETWTNVTLPDDIHGRASPELVWVPVGEQGILVALGGVVYPEFVEAAHASENQTASEDQSPLFMSDIDIYDIANDVWYTQSTTGGPGALALGCAVMQPAQDYSSFNIYWYGGYDGIHASNASYWSDAVWVLSLPSFTWTQLTTGRDSMARAGHKCVMPYPDQMMVIGGAPVGQDSGYSCVNDFIQIFNVSSAEWLPSYDPTVWYDYEVPSVIYGAIGGDVSGGATKTAPSRWDTSALAGVFQTAYATSKITTYYPYREATTTGSTTNPTYTPNTTGSSHNGVPKYLAPLLGVILGLVFVSSLVVGFLLWRRRRLLKKNGGVSIVTTDENGNRILSWINGQGTEAKAETITTSDELVHPTSPTPDVVGFRQAQQYPFTQQYRGQNEQMQEPYMPTHHEMDNTQVVELPDTSPPAAELSDSPMAPSEIVARRFANNSPRDTYSMGWSSIQATDQGSMVSSTSFARNAPPAPPSSESYATSSVAGSQPPAQRRPPVRPDSTALPTPLARSYEAQELSASPAGGGSSSSGAGAGGYSHTHTQSQSQSQSQDQNATTPRGESGVSAFSERDRTHLRNLSDPATVSTMDGTIASVAPRSQTYGGRSDSRPIMEEGAVAAANEGQAPSIVSPPTGSEAEGEDYLSARAMGDVSPVNVRSEQPGPGGVRRGAFRESDEDLGAPR